MLARGFRGRLLEVIGIDFVTAGAHSAEDILGRANKAWRLSSSLLDGDHVPKTIDQSVEGIDRLGAFVVEEERFHLLHPLANFLEVTLDRQVVREQFQVVAEQRHDLDLKGAKAADRLEVFLEQFLHLSDCARPPDAPDRGSSSAGRRYLR